MIVASVSLVSSLDTLLTQTAIVSATTRSQNAAQRVAVGQGSSASVQYYTYTPQSVEINAGESVTWFSPAELSDTHTVTFVQDPSIVSDIILPFAVPAGDGATNLELLPPFNLGEPLIISTSNGGQVIAASAVFANTPKTVPGISHEMVDVCPLYSDKGIALILLNWSGQPINSISITMRVRSSSANSSSQGVHITTEILIPGQLIPPTKITLSSLEYVDVLVISYPITQS